jgi:hypothetical protein
MLGVERLHVMIKKLGKSKRNIMKSIQKNVDDYVLSQLTWRHDSDHQWVNQAALSSFQVKQPVKPAIALVMPSGAMQKSTVDSIVFQYLQDEWAIKNEHFSSFREKYRTYADKCQQLNQVPVAFREWRVDKTKKNTPEQRKWQSMDNKAWTVTRAFVDGVLFRTKPSQDKKKTKTDNSCMVAEINCTDEDGRTVKDQKCYGVIIKFYFHFMYPPKKSTYKLTSKKLVKFEEPWILCALCDWYEQVGTKVSTGLVQIQQNPYWSGCPISNMANTMPYNVVFWPSQPFDADDFDDDGEYLYEGFPDFSGTGVFDVVVR